MVILNGHFFCMEIKPCSIAGTWTNPASLQRIRSIVANASVVFFSVLLMANRFWHLLCLIFGFYFTLPYCPQLYMDFAWLNMEIHLTWCYLIETTNCCICFHRIFLLNNAIIEIVFKQVKDLKMDWYVKLFHPIKNNFIYYL